MLVSRLCILLLLATGISTAQSFYVSPHGKAGWSGSLADPNSSATDGPLPSIEAARDLLRAHPASPHKPVHIILRAGTYFLQAPFELGPQDSGIAGAPVSYEAYPGEHPVISGGRPIDGWSQNDKKIWTTTYATPITQLFVNGTRAVRSKTPSYGYFRIEGPSSREEHFLLHYSGDDIKPEWANSGAEVVVLLAWAEMRRPILAVDPATHTATLGGPSRFSTHEENARFWVENAPGDLAVDGGVWQQDRAHETLSFRPRKDQKILDSPTVPEFIAPALTQLVILLGDQAQPIHDIEFHGLTFRHSAWTEPAEGFADSQAARAADSAIQVTYGQRIHVEASTFDALGGYAIHLHTGSRQNVVVNNTFFDLGAGAIRIGEEGMPKSDADQVRQNIFANNQVHDAGLVYPSAVGVWVGQSGNNLISHNHIHHLGYSAISVGWVWGYGPSAADHNIIEFNHIHDIGGVLSDLGGIYLLSVQPGSIVRNNVIHDITCFTYGGWGIYLDEGSSNVLVEDNIVYDTQSSGFHQHYGRDNILRNNIFAFGGNYQLARTRAEATQSFSLEHNIILYDTGTLLGYDWTGSGFISDHNLFWDMRGQAPVFGGLSWSEWQKQGHDAHSIVADPMFAAALSFDFRLAKNSPAAGLGIHPIDISYVGPQANAHYSIAVGNSERK
jgi:parallel beta-helix repeat protein